MRVLIVADNASSRFGGEAFLPLNYFRLLRARNVDVRLLVHQRNQEELTSSFPDDLSRLHFIKDTPVHKWASHFGRHLPRRVSAITADLVIQLTTQYAQRRIILEFSREDKIDVVHVPTPVSPKTPSLIFGLNLPVIFGPLNGGMQYPPAFARAESTFTRFSVSLGRKLANLANVIFPGKKQAQLLLVANDRTRQALPLGARSRVAELVENGVDLSIWNRREQRPREDGVIRLVFVGRLVDWKAVHIVLEAIERLKGTLDISLEIIGEGPMLPTWKRLSVELGLASVVTFTGWLSQEDCALRLQQGDVFVLPSLFECGGAVVLEAMAMGLPIIATGWGGPLDYLDASCGILIPPISRDSLITGFADGIKKLAESSDLRRQMGQAGYNKAKREFSWNTKIDEILGHYKSAVLSHRLNSLR